MPKIFHGPHKNRLPWLPSYILNVRSLSYFFNSKLYLICFLQFYFIKCLKNFITFQITNNIFQRYIVYKFFNHKNFFRSISNGTFGRNVFVFWYSYMIANINLSTFFTILFIKVNVCAWLYINRLHFDCSMICIVVFIDYII